MNNNLKKYLTLIILGLAGGSIYIFPYLKYVFYDPLIQVLHISDTQSGLLLTMYAIGCVILYIPGGILADKMNPKKALMLSLADRYLSASMAALHNINRCICSNNFVRFTWKRCLWYFISNMVAYSFCVRICILDSNS